MSQALAGVATDRAEDAHEVDVSAHHEERVDSRHVVDGIIFLFAGQPTIPAHSPARYGPGAPVAGSLGQSRGRCWHSHQPRPGHSSCRRPRHALQITPLLWLVPRGSKASVPYADQGSRGARRTIAAGEEVTDDHAAGTGRRTSR